MVGFVRRPIDHMKWKEVIKIRQTPHREWSCKSRKREMVMITRKSPRERGEKKIRRNQKKKTTKGNDRASRQTSGCEDKQPNAGRVKLSYFCVGWLATPTTLADSAWSLLLFFLLGRIDSREVKRKEKKNNNKMEKERSPTWSHCQRIGGGSGMGKCLSLLLVL